MTPGRPTIACAPSAATAGARRLNRVWLALLLATAATVVLAAAGWIGATRWAVPLTFVLVVGKGLAVALEFMELRRAPALWRALVGGWLLLVAALVVLAWALGRAG